MQRCKNLFERIDTNHDGRLDMQELKAFMGGELNDLIGMEIKDEKELMELLDTDGSNYVEYSELVTLVYKRGLLLSERNLLIAFNALRGENEVITKENLQRAFGLSRDQDEQHKSRNDKIWDTMIKSVDKNKDNVIDQTEFMNTMQNMLEQYSKIAETQDD